MGPSAKAARIDLPASNPVREMPSFSQFPRDLLKKVFEYLGTLELRSCMLVCKRFKLIIEENIYQYQELAELVQPQNFRSAFEHLPQKMNGGYEFKQVGGVLEVSNGNIKYSLQLPPGNERGTNIPWGPLSPIKNAFFIKPGKIICVTKGGSFFQWDLTTEKCEKALHLNPSERHFYIGTVILEEDFLILSGTPDEGIYTLNLNAPEALVRINNTENWLIKKMNGELVTVVARTGQVTTLKKISLVPQSKCERIADAGRYLGNFQNFVVTCGRSKSTKFTKCSVYDVAARKTVARRILPQIKEETVTIKNILIRNSSEDQCFDFHYLPSLKKFASIDFKSLGLLGRHYNLKAQFFDKELVLVFYDTLINDNTRRKIIHVLSISKQNVDQRLSEPIHAKLGKRSIEEVK